ncbi:hypothetical protein H7I55_22660 [Mycolicibacterium setense]|uniref:hypothetical protein n=2 Tax=Mycolicibacterium setense TaxID=431269 RepID=UPI00103EE998|nr:hypothetical protein [Mycolicibacterium setense]MCV7113765.1 hypothetical protein [Mycolicibacterium setense]
MDRSWVRNTAAGCAIACGAMVVGPGMLGTGVASADLFGIDLDILDIFDHKDKKKSDHSAKVGNQRTGGAKKSNGSLGGPNASAASKASTGPKAKVGSSGSTSSGSTSSDSASSSSSSSARSAATEQAPQSAGVTGTADQAPTAAITTGGTAAAAQAPSAVVSGGGGGGGAPANGNLGRAPNLAPVPTAPSSRTIVIRSTPPTAPAVQAPAAPVAPAPVVAPPVPVIPAPMPSAPPAGAPSAPSAPAPQSEPPASQPISVPAVPESFRIGYADYLRTASTSDLLFAVLPGLGGIVLMTAAGGVAGFRQARAAQTLPSPQISRFLP